MKKIWKIGSVLVIIGLISGAVLGLTAFADETDEGPRGPIAEFAAQVRGRFAEKLGKTPQELDGLWGEAMDEQIAQAVEDGLLTPEQAAKLSAQELPFGHMPRGPREARRNVVQHLERDVVRIAAEQMGMEPQELLIELRTGKSIADVAEEQGIELDDISDAILAHVQADLDAAVEKGNITQEQADELLAQVAERLPGMLTRVYGRPGDHAQFRFKMNIQEIIATELGMTIDALHDALRDGNSVADLAGEAGVDLQVIVDAILDAAEAELDGLVEAGTITQERADEILANLAETLPDRLSQTPQPRPPQGGPRGSKPGEGRPGMGMPGVIEAQPIV